MVPERGRAYEVAQPESLRFEFRKDEHYRVVPVNGAWGGPTLRGDVRVDLFLEETRTPSVLTQKITGEGKLGESIEPTDVASTGLIRTLMVGLVLSPSQARDIGQWLIRKADEIMSLRSSDEKPGKDADA